MTLAKGNGCSNQVSALVASMQEKASRNKRKFRAEPHLGDVNRTASSAQVEGFSYEFTAEKFEVTPGHVEPGACDVCGVDDGHSDALNLQLGLSNSAGASGIGLGQPAKDLGDCEFQYAGWSDVAETDLQELVLSNLDAIFKCAIKIIVSCGYSEDVATRGVLQSGVCYGCKDPVLNVVDNTLTFLRSGRELKLTGNDCFKNLQELERYILAELVCILKEVKPFFSTGDALWWLLLFDMNVSQACPVVSDSLGSFMSDGTSSGTYGNSTYPQLKAEVKNIELHLPSASARKAVASNTCLHSAQSEVTTVAEPSNIITKPKDFTVLHGQISQQGGTHPASDSINKPISVTGTCQPPAIEEKFITSRKVHSGYSKRELLRQRSIHLEKGYRTYGSKGFSRTGKLGSSGGRILDKKVKSVSESSTVSLKTASLRISKAMGIDMPQDGAKENILVQAGSFSPAAFKLETCDTISSLPKADVVSFPSPALPVAHTSPALPADDTELSLSLPAKAISSIASSSCNATISYDGAPNDKFMGHWIPQEKKDETILKLVPRVQELQSQLQEWTEWANQKVMEAARRLGKDKVELKMLRQEKEEVECFNKDKQALEESTMKKLAEMENALYNASGQVDRANAAVCRLEVENAALKREMEAAKLRAAESAANCLEASEREKKTLMECRSWERQKGTLQEELTIERRKVAKFQQELEQAKVLQEQIERRCKQEEKAKDELLMLTSSLKQERERVEASTKTKEDIIKSKAEKNLQRCKDDIERLEKEISQLRLKTDSSRIAALKQGINGSYVSKLLDAKSDKAHKDFWCPAVSTAQSLGYSEIGGVKRERECVMCLSEEMTVVFLPCAHQVVCNACNEMHEKQGMKDCPSCRSPIQRRISVRYSRT